MNAARSSKLRMLYNLDFPKTELFRDYKGLQSMAGAFQEMGHAVREIRTEEELRPVFEDFRPDVFLFYFHWLGNPGRNVPSVPWDLEYLKKYKADNDLKVFIRGAALTEAQVFFRDTPVWKEELKQFLRYDIDNFPNAFQRSLLESGTIDCWLSLHTESYTRLFAKDFAEFGIESLSIPLATDRSARFKVDPVPDLRCEVVYVGGYWEYKGRTIDRYLLRMALPSPKALLVQVYVFPRPARSCSRGRVMSG